MPARKKSLPVAKLPVAKLPVAKRPKDRLPKDRAKHIGPRPAPAPLPDLRPLRLGLCCTFAEQHLNFRVATAAHLATLSRRGAREKLGAILAHNARATAQAIRFCGALNIGAFRSSSRVAPLRTHPDVGYDPASLPGGKASVRAFRDAGKLAEDLGVRTLLHPEQITVLSAHDPAVVQNAVEELVHQAEIAGWLRADTLTIHAGGGYGDKPAALARFAENVRALPAEVRDRLAVENDDRVFTPADLLPTCDALGLPLVYDAHHHRVLPDGLSEEDVTRSAIASWANCDRPAGVTREPVFHLSSPKEGWDGPKPHRHADHIAPADWPAVWTRVFLDGGELTVEVEAKAKELAVAGLADALAVR